MFKESFGFPWDSSELSEDYKKLSVEEKIDFLYHKFFGDNPDENDPALKEFNIAVKMIRESLKRNKKES